MKAAERKHMKSMIVATIILLAHECLCSLPNYVLAGIGYAANTHEMIMVMGIPTEHYSNGLPGGVYGKLISSSHGSPKGTQTKEPPFDWWVLTGEKIWDKHIIHIGYMIPIKKLPRLTIAPYFGFGAKNTYTQYRSTATGLMFYQKSVKDRSDIGIDILVIKKHLGAFVGCSRQYPLQLGIVAGF